MSNVSIQALPTCFDIGGRRGPPTPSPLGQGGTATAVVPVVVSTRSVDIAICSHTPSKYLLGPSRPSTEIRGMTEGYWAWMVLAPGTKGPCLIPNHFFPLLEAMSHSWPPSRWRKFFQEVHICIFSLWLQLLTSLGFPGLPVRGTLLVTRDSLRTPRKWCSPALYPDSELHL